jgi:hypothetical protein
MIWALWTIAVLLAIIVLFVITLTATAGAMLREMRSIALNLGFIANCNLQFTEERETLHDDKA